MNTQTAKLGHYDQFYKSGGWNYNENSEKALLSRVFGLARVPASGSVLEIGAGMGFHSKFLHDLGYKVTSNELSREGIEHGKSMLPGPTYLQGNAREVVNALPRRSFDAVFIRGMSWYHYPYHKELRRDGIDIVDETRRFAETVKRGGAFILMIATRYTGTYHGTTRIYNHRWDDFDHLFKTIGTIEHRENWGGEELRSEADALGAKRTGMTVIVRI